MIWWMEPYRDSLIGFLPWFDDWKICRKHVIVSLWHYEVITWLGEIGLMLLLSYLLTVLMCWLECSPLQNDICLTSHFLLDRFQFPSIIGAIILIAATWWLDIDEYLPELPMNYFVDFQESGRNLGVSAVSWLTCQTVFCITGDTSQTRAKNFS